jgi:hypothetical protein
MDQDRQTERSLDMTALTKPEPKRDRRKRELATALAAIGARVIADDGHGQVVISCPRGREARAQEIAAEHGVIIDC